VGEYQRKGDARNAVGTCTRTNGLRRSSAGWRILRTRLRRWDLSAPSGSRADVWRVEPELRFTEAAGVPRASDGAGPYWWPERRCGYPPNPCATTLTASGSRVRLSVFEENRRKPRCTGSHPEQMRPHHRPLLEKTPLGLRAHFGSSRVREDLPRHVREVGRSGLGSANHSPAPIDANPVRRSRSL
jgi:hypothetical protein